MQEKHSVGDRPLANERTEVGPDDCGMFYHEESSVPRPPEDDHASEWQQRQGAHQRFPEQDSYDSNDGRRSDGHHSPRDPREPNNYQEARPRAYSVTNRRNWRSFSNRPNWQHADARWAYKSRRPRYYREEQMRYWDRHEKHERPLAYEEMRHSERRHPPEPDNEIGGRRQSSRRRTVRDEAWKRSRTQDKLARLHDTIDRLRAELMACQDQRYLAEKEIADFEVDLEEVRGKLLRAVDSLRKQDLTIEKMDKKILIQEDKLQSAVKELSTSKSKAERLQMELKQLRAGRKSIDENIQEKNTEIIRENDELKAQLQKSKSHISWLCQEQATFQLVKDENTNLKRQIKIMKQQLQGKEIEQEPQSHCDGPNNIYQACKVPVREKSKNDKFRSDVCGQPEDIHQDLCDMKLDKQELRQKNRGLIEDNSRLVDEKLSDHNVEKKSKSADVYQSQSENTSRTGYFPDYTRTRRSQSSAPTEDREALEEPTRRGRSPVARCSYARRNDNNTAFRQRARSQAEPPRWFSQMDRYTRDSLERMFAQADKDYSGDTEAIQCILKDNFGLELGQCTEIYNYFMRSEFVYRNRRWSPCSTGRYYRNRSPNWNGSSLNSFFISNSEPRKYDGPLKGRDNTFWVKFRNPHLKEQIEAAEGPVLTPTQTPDTSPEPEPPLEKKSE